MNRPPTPQGKPGHALKNMGDGFRVPEKEKNSGISPSRNLKQPERSRRWFHRQGKQVLTCVMFILWSTIATISNKHVLGKVLPSSNMLFFIQSIINLIFVWTAKQVGIIESDEINFSLEQFNGPNRRGPIFVGLCYTGNILFALASLVYLTVPVFNTLKRLTIAFVWVGEYVVLHTQGAMDYVPPLAVMIIGTIGVAAFDLTFDFVGYTCALISCVAHAGAMVGSKKIGQTATKEVSATSQTWATLWTNSLVSSGILVLVITLSGEWHHIQTIIHSPIKVGLPLFCNGVCVIALNFCIFFNCVINSPMTHAVVANMKTLVTSISSFLFFSQPVNVEGLISMFLNFIAACWYSAIKYQKHSKKTIHTSPTETNSSNLTLSFSDREKTSLLSSTGMEHLSSSVPSRSV